MTEDQIPEFLRRRPKGEKKEFSRFTKLIETYENKFGDDLPTEPSSWSEEEWCEMIEECLRENKTVEELFGFEYDDCEY